jgi:hypothetical protein
MQNPSKAKKRKLAYKLHLIAYLDILGFRDLIKSKPPGFISHVIGRAIQWTSPDKKDQKSFQENYVNFSDLIVHTIPLETPAVRAAGGDLYYEIKNLAFAQAALINEGVLLRGALTVGLLERTYKVLFGPGLIAGYELERDYAQFPRIILSPGLFQQNKATRLLWAHEFHEEMKYLGEYVKRDDDGLVFIDYLSTWREAARTEASFLEFLQTHKKLIERGIDEHNDNGKVLQKYLWLKKYHDAVVRKRVRERKQHECLVAVAEPAPEIPNLL